jgi:hypothetical protein
MKIFSPVPESAAKAESKSVKNEAKGPAMKKQAPAPEKKAISETEIREKLAAHVETSNSAKSKTIQQNSKQFGAGFMNAEMKPEPIVAPPAAEKTEEAKEETDSKDSHLLKTDINLNDPKDPNTQEKLKTVLSKGAFNFNAKEREALDKILNA